MPYEIPLGITFMAWEGQPVFFFPNVSAFRYFGGNTLFPEGWQN